MLQDAPLKQQEVGREQKNEHTPVQKQLEPDQQDTRKRCVLNIQDTKNSSNEEQQRQEKSVIEQPQEELKKSRKEGRHHGVYGQAMCCG